ncbi:MAG: dephospho-CoA kinase [Bacteroidales bacterium]|nr:dephospho-CoA kinase [Bacteroidales bacterium]HNW73000.1 dephospho-CoA kinase [Bacteroidales bacterium]HPS50958.1 dephospho-CoA kinase [Bacteroidales bacterium]
MILRVGLTGNIGSGKSTVAGIFKVLGIPVFHADEEAKKCYNDPELRRDLVHQFGERILIPGGEIDRKALAAIVFNDPASLEYLNTVVHPLVGKAFTRWMTVQTQAPYILQEAAIIFESGLGGSFDRIIHVSCPKEIAINRVMKRDAADGNSVLKRMQFQIPDEEKARMADFVILNDGSSLVIPQVCSIHAMLLKIGA